ncbi:hypothetical protein Glove_136g49 [Diversispora epigaea]|uniref:RNase H type-1 domain-containing protein n=1 Tax=Diversispora epigaea TaxID=1348612 RepID=A0A397J370_9GLOM|nr:hypothetical protein Glove_136g49 [Diversispora epigaea]
MRPKRGRPPKWYTQIIQNKDLFLKTIREKLENLYEHNINVFTNLQKKNISSKNIWIAQREGKELIIGKEIKKKINDKNNEDSRMKHFNVLGKNLEPTSVLIPCEGCDLNMEENNNSCIYRLDNNKIDKIEIPVSYSTVSTTDTLPKKYKNRIRIKNHSLHKAFDIMDDYIINNIEENISDANDITNSLQYDTNITLRSMDFNDISSNIMKWISGDKGKLMELTTIKDKIKSRNQVIVYTDGSLTNNLWEDIMGFGWVIPEKCKNPVILQIISEIIKEKTLKITCYKVKAHSGDKFNEIADELAVIPKSLCKFYNDIFEGTTISLNYKNIKNRNFIPMWKSSLLEIPIKQAIKEIYKVKTMIDWKFQERFKYFTNSEKNKIVNWNLTFKTKHPSKLTAMKLFCEELPSITKRHLHRPDLYENAECILCDRAEEDNLHIFTCKRGGDEDPIKDLIIKFKIILREKILKNKPQTKELLIQNGLNTVTCLNYYGEADYESTKHSPYFTFFEIIKGYIPDILTNKITEIYRCEKVIEWEKENEITIRAKKKKNIKIKFANRSQHNQDRMFIMGEKSDEEKEYLKEKQKIKKEKIDYFIDDIFLKTKKKKNIKIKFANRSQHNQDGMFIMGEKSDEEKEYLKEKQKIKKEKIDYFIDDIFLKSCET